MKLNNLYQHDRNSEIAYLQDLIDLFGCQSDLQAEKEIKKLYARFLELENQRTLLLQIINQEENSYYELCLNVHRFLYHNILKNAGNFRQINDPNEGNVYFGGINYRTMKNKFVGTKPHLIRSELKQAFNLLFNQQYQPPESSIRFYAEFVAVHPFYDANGRIGRYIVDIYLQAYNYYVDWQSINEKHGKFLRKLNYCHSVRERSKQSNPNHQNYWLFIREKYLSYLVSFWSKFVISIDP